MDIGVHVDLTVGHRIAEPDSAHVARDRADALAEPIGLFLEPTWRRPAIAPAAGQRSRVVIIERCTAVKLDWSRTPIAMFSPWAWQRWIDSLLTLRANRRTNVETRIEVSGPQSG